MAPSHPMLYFLTFAGAGGLVGTSLVKINVLKEYATDRIDTQHALGWLNSLTKPEVVGVATYVGALLFFKEWLLLLGALALASIMGYQHHRGSLFVNSSHVGVYGARDQLDKLYKAVLCISVVVAFASMIGLARSIIFAMVKAQPYHFITVFVPKWMYT